MQLNTGVYHVSSTSTLSTSDAVAAMRRDYPLFARNCLQIQTKDSQQVPFEFNPIQEDYWRKMRDELRDGRGFIRDYVLKPRQLGFSTFILGNGYWDTIRREHVTTAIVAHEKSAAQNLLDIVHRYFDYTPEWIRPAKPKFRSRHEFYFREIDGRIIIGTAGNLNLGRSRTIHNLHASEFAFWDENGDARAILQGLLQTIPSDGNIILETTAKNYGSYAHKLWLNAKRGTNDWRPIFYAWFDHPLYANPLDDGEYKDIHATLEAHEITLLENHAVTFEQLKWRRLKIAELNGDVESFDQEYPANDVICWLSAGRPFFNIDIIKKLIDEAVGKEPIEVSDPMRQGGAVVYGRRVWKRPEPFHLYVIGADVSEGLPHGDFSGAGVLDYVTGEQVAEIHGLWDPNEFARKLADLGAEYNGALLGVERNNHGHSTLNALINWLGYPHIYMHDDYDRNGELIGRPGWPTNVKTRPVMLDQLKTMIENRYIRVNDVDLLEECLGFNRNDRGKPEAATGMHDDRIMKWAIANMMREMRPSSTEIETIDVPVRIGIDY